MIRNLFDYKLALGTTTPQFSDTILGSGYASRGFDTSTIRPKGHEGLGCLLAEGADPLRERKAASAP